MNTPATMRNVLFAIWFSFGLMANCYAQIGNNPFEPLLREYNLKSQKLLGEMESKIEKIKLTFVAGVIKQKGLLEGRGETAAAKTLGDLLGQIEKAPDNVSASDIIAGELLPLDTGVHDLVIAFLDEVLKIDKEYAPKLDKLKQATIKSMKQKVPKGARVAPDFAQRTAKFMSDFISIPNPKFDGVAPALPEDDSEAELIYHRTRAEFEMAMKRDILRQTNQLYVNLYRRRLDAQVAKEEVILKQLLKIDEAFHTQKTIANIFGDGRRAKDTDIQGVPDRDNPSSWVSSNRKAIDDSIEPILMEHAEECKAIRDRHGEYFAKLDLLWAGRNSKEIKKLLLSDAPLETQISELSRHLRLTRESYPWLTNSYTEPLPGIDPEMMPWLDELDKEAHDLVQDADVKDAELRNALIVKLKAIPDADAIEESGKLDVVASLTSDYGEGIRGTLVFDVDPRLNPEASKLVEQYLEKAENLRNEMNSAHAKNVAECRSKLRPKRVALVQKNDFLGAALIDLHIARRTYPIKPIWIRICTQVSPFSTQAAYDLSSPALLFARSKEKGFLILGANRQLDWLARDRVTLSYSDYSTSEDEIAKHKIWTNRYEFNPKHPSSKPLEVGMRLKKGDQVLVPVLIGWHERRVEDLSPFGVVVRVSDKDVSSSLDILPRGIVRWINEQKAE